MIHEDAYVRYFGDQDEHREYRVARVHDDHVDLDDGYHGHIQATPDEYEVIEDIRAMYKQEKERADRLERRWEMLKDYLRINSKKWEPLYPGGAGICEELVENDDIKISNVLNEMHELEQEDTQ